MPKVDCKKINKERPIIFSAPMVRSLMSGIKTQTRRVAKDQGDITSSDNPYGDAGNLLWVKESWRTLAKFDKLKPSLIPINAPIEYKADSNSNSPEEMSDKWRTPLFMPKRFARLELEIIGVRYERLMECNQQDAIAEGIESADSDPIGQYKSIWEDLHGIESWYRNPWVWVIEFKVSR